MLALLAASLIAAGSTGSKIRVVEKIDGCGCYHELRYSWKPVEGGWSSPFGRVDDASVASIRAAILGAPGESADLLAAVGFTAEALASRRQQVLDAAWRSDERPKDMTSISPWLDSFFAYERLAPRVRAELLGRREFSTSQAISVVLPGYPEIRIESEGRSPYALPWTITSGGRTRTSDDVAISLALLPLLDRNRTCPSRVDGAQYWAHDFWSDENAWRSILGDELRRIWAERLAQQVPGWDELARRMTLRRATILVELEPCAESSDAKTSRRSRSASSWLSVELAPIDVGSIDGFTCECELRDDVPVGSWLAAARIHDEIERAVEPHRWLVDWRCLSAVRTALADLDPPGTAVVSEARARVERLWRHAGLGGRPEFRVELRRNDLPKATVWFSSEEPRALVLDAERSVRLDPFDALDFEGDPARYAVIDRNGATRVDRVVE